MSPDINRVLAASREDFYLRRARELERLEMERAKITGNGPDMGAHVADPDHRNRHQRRRAAALGRKK